MDYGERIKALRARIALVEDGLTRCAYIESIRRTEYLVEALQRPVPGADLRALAHDIDGELGHLEKRVEEKLGKDAWVGFFADNKPIGEVFQVDVSRVHNAAKLKEAIFQNPHARVLLRDLPLVHVEIWFRDQHLQPQDPVPGGSTSSSPVHCDLSHARGGAAAPRSRFDDL